MQDYQWASKARLSGIALSGNTIQLQAHNTQSRWRKRVRAQLVLSGVDGRRTPKTRKTHVLVDGVVRTHPLLNLRADFVAIPSVAERRTVGTP
jgi:hypothetical protein